MLRHILLRWCRAEYDPKSDLWDQEFMLRGKWYQRKDVEVKFAIQYMRRAIQKLLGCTEENPEEGKGCCLIVLFSYLYFG
ncbi:hypothetical protein AHAS_Ahas17G0247400 [Arachis hypogaea]